MELNIFVYTNLQEVTKDYPYNFKAYNQPDFEGLCTAFDGFYKGACIYDFSLSYGAHNRFHEELAWLAGYEAEESWREPNKFIGCDFIDHINFSDFEGCMDYNTAEVLYHQYTRHSFAAMLEWDAPIIKYM